MARVSAGIQTTGVTSSLGPLRDSLSWRPLHPKACCRKLPRANSGFVGNVQVLLSCVGRPWAGKPPTFLRSPLQVGSSSAIVLP